MICPCGAEARDPIAVLATVNQQPPQFMGDLACLGADLCFLAELRGECSTCAVGSAAARMLILRAHETMEVEE